jgi:hypothetical protein
MARLSASVLAWRATLSGFPPRGMQPRIGLAQPGQLTGRVGRKPHYT